MVDVTNLLESEWLNTKNTVDGDQVVVLNEGQTIDKEGKSGKYQQLELEVNYKGKKRKLSVNKNSLLSVSSKHGADTKQWVGKNLTLKHVLTGKMVNMEPEKKLFILP